MWILNGRESAIAQTVFNYGRRSVQMLLTTDSETAFLNGRMSRGSLTTTQPDGGDAKLSI
jgi:hypothetical protein